jgi:O-antigen/teichoic acid export membrane protein
LTAVLKRLPVNALLAVAGQFFASLTNFGTGVIVGRACGPTEYGLYFLGFTILVFLLELQNALISTPYSVYAPRQAEGEAAWYRGSVLAHQGTLSLLVSAGFLLAALVSAAGFGPHGMAPVFMALAAASVFFLLRDQTRRLCFAHMQMRTALVCDALVAVLQLGGLYAVYRAGWLTPAAAYGVVGVACAVVSLGYFWLADGGVKVSFARGREDFARHWVFGKWVVASAVLWGVSMNFYPWLINYYQGPEQAGVWGAAFTLVSLGNVFMMGVHNFLGPKIASVYATSGAPALRRYVFEANAALAVPMLGLCAVLYIAGEWMLGLVYGEAFAAGAPVMTVLAINLTLLALAFVFSRGLFAIERADLDFQVNFIPLVLLFAAGIPLVREYGIKGAAWALCLANGVALCCRMAAFLIAQPREEVVAG